MTKRSTLGWLELILGILFIVLGIYTLVKADVALGGIVIVYGLLAILTGIVDIVLYVKLDRRLGIGPVLTLVAGILSILCGVLILFNVGAGAWALSILFPIWFIMHCIVGLCYSGVTKRVSGTGMFVLMLILNILGIILGMLMLFNPWASALTLVYFVGFYLVLLGIQSLVLAISNVGAKR